MLERLAAHGARAAIASGVLAAISTLLFAMAFASAVASAQFEAASPLARATIATSGLAALAALPLAARLHRTWRLRAARDSALVFGLAIASLTVVGVAHLASAAGMVGSGTASLLSTVAFVGAGAWLTAVNLRRASLAVVGNLRWLGLAIGISYLWALPTFLASGPRTDGFPTWILVLVFIGSVPSFFVANVGYPIWAIWLGRRLLRSED